jgi:hypothetical protein
VLFCVAIFFIFLKYNSQIPCQFLEKKREKNIVLII